MSVLPKTIRRERELHRHRRLLHPPPSSPPAGTDDFDVGDPPPPKTHARAAWNIETTRRLLREKGTVRARHIREAIGLGAGAARLAVQALIDSGEVMKTGERAATKYHWQSRLEEEPGGEEAMSGSTRTREEEVSGSTHTPSPPVAERKAPVDAGPPAGRGRTAQSEGAEPSFQGLMHQRLVIKPMSLGAMLEEWPERSEQEIRQALGENMKAGDVAPKHKGGDTRYHGRP